MSQRATMRVRILLAIGLALMAAAGYQVRAAEKAAAEARLLADLKYLASDECEGRGITTKGINLAADYIADEFKKAGLKPAGADGTYFQPFAMVTGAKLGQTNQLTLRGPQGQTVALEMGRHFTVMAFGGSGKISAPVVFAGYGATAPEHSYDDYDKLDVAGKVVIVLRQRPRAGNEHTGEFPARDGGISPHASLQTKASNAEIHKAAAVIFVNDNLSAAEASDQLRDFRSTSMGFDPVTVPLVHLRRSYVNMMIRSETGGTDLSEIERAIDRDLKPNSFALSGWTCQLETEVARETTTVKNVIGVLEGSGPLAKETIVIGAHYDHLGYGGRSSRERDSKAIHYGADDNASGTASLLELARRFGSMPERQGRRLVFMAFTAEESGLIGSAYYCKRPIFPLESTVAMVNMDMVGRLRDDKLILYGTGTGKGLSELVERLNQKHKFKISKSDGVSDATSFGGSDHFSFYAKGIPALHFFTGIHPEYHKPTDKIETISVPGVRRVTDMIEDVVADLAAAEKRPEYVRIQTARRPAGPAGPRLQVVPDYSDDKVGEGLLLADVTEGGPAHKAGLRGGDRIVDIGGKPVKDINGYMILMRGFKKGDEFDVTVLRKDKKEKFAVVLE